MMKSNTVYVFAACGIVIAIMMIGIFALPIFVLGFILMSLLVIGFLLTADIEIHTEK